MIKKIIRKIQYNFPILRKGFNTSLRKVVGKSDINRWSNPKNLSQDWDARTKQIAYMIEPGASVIEFGAGRLVLKKFLPKSCSYTPSDLVYRGPGTIICDLNAETLPSLHSFDVAVFSGVLEYVYNIPKLLNHLSESVTSIYTSYAVLEMNKENRRAEGWVNDYGEKEFITIFEKAGFQCEHTEKWESQILFKFTQI